MSGPAEVGENVTSKRAGKSPRLIVDGSGGPDTENPGEPAVIDEVVAAIRVGVPLPASDLIREIDKQLDEEPLAL